MVLRAFDLIARNRIEAAIEQGAFDDLPGAGKAQSFEDERFIPPEQRMAYRLLKNAGCVPAEVRARVRLAALEALLAELERATLDPEAGERAARVATEISLLRSQLGGGSMLGSAKAPARGR